ncbi:MAG: hypothetical protein ABR582_04420 [Gemmatimonadaceae bacterium]
MTSARWVCIAFLLVAGSAGAQGTLSTQGFGYPPGEFSSRALGTGGALAQFDPQSAINPASIGASDQPLLFMQYEPEFRRLSTGTATQKTTTSRFPLAIAALPVGTRTTIAVSVATLLDRSWQTSTTRDEIIGGDKTTITENVKSIGAIDDVRIAASWIPNQYLQFGVGGHVFTGQNRLFFNQSFPDTLAFVPVNQISQLDYTGLGVSAGAVIHSSVFALALSGRKGGNLHAHSGDTVVATAKIPDRYGAAISFSGIPGAVVSAQVDRNLWSSMNGLGSQDARAVDAWDTGVGLEATGPRLLERVVLLRLGARYRTLPFVAGDSEVRELAFAAGLGAQFSRNRAAFDVTLQHASRSPNSSTTIGDVRERAYTLSFGLRVRP